MSKHSQLAQAIVDLLNSPANNWSIQFLAKRRSAPLTVKEVEELHTLDVAVYTGSIKAERRTRAEFNRVYKPVIGIVRKLDSGDEASKLSEVDSLDGLQEEMEAVLEDSGFTIGGTALEFMGFDEEQDREKYSAQLMQSFDVYASSVLLEYSD